MKTIIKLIKFLFACAAIFILFATAFELGYNYDKFKKLDSGEKVVWVGESIQNNYRILVNESKKVINKIKK
jgi:hypothetical protein